MRSIRHDIRFVFILIFGLLFIAYLVLFLTGNGQSFIG